MGKSLALDIQREAKVHQILTLLATGDCNLTTACEQAGISRKTWWLWCKQGLVEPKLVQLKTGMTTEFITKSAGRWANIVDGLLSDAEGEGLSARDRDSARRTVNLLLKQLGSTLPETAPSGDGIGWVERNKHRFPPLVSITDSQVVVQQSGTFEPVLIGRKVPGCGEIIVDGEIVADENDDDATE